MDSLRAGAGAVIVFRSRHRPACAERALVLKALGIDHAVGLLDGAWTVSVPAPQAPFAVRQLDEYARESRDWPRKRVRVPFHRVGIRGVAAYVVVLLVVAALDGNMVLDLDWFGAGRVHTELVRSGEWWRTLTSLTLHLDFEHLLGNVLFGALFGLIVGQLLGNGLAWFSILVAGALGNGLNTLVQPPQHTAAGASTGVFAALGLLAAYVWRRRRDLKGRWAVRWSPLVGGVVLLAYLGSGGERTDIIAHLTGFLAGLGMGAYYGGLGPGVVVGPRGQWLLGMGALGLLAVAWAIALGAHG
ncbi:MAG: rhomboid family intramembrane serine protease [Planctomycetota bacterium]|jgi:MYXO-CTERM domain-containing protein